ncbi:MAG TPA: response regulator transcription factor [Bacteroidia bacterium]|nr:response regulator transcription factor [Bacteroidia bacterium]
MKTSNSIVVWFEDRNEERLLTEYLQKNGFSCAACHDRKQFDELIHTSSILVIDLNLKETDAILLCHEIKQKKEANTPFIIIIGDKLEDYTHVTALDLGADDYVMKPVKLQLFLKRIEALCRRKNIGLEKNNGHETGFNIDMERHVVLIDSNEFDLPKKEFDLLNLFFSVPNKIFTREEIAILLWKDESIARQRTIDVHIRNIRKILGKELIKTVKGFGYGLNKVNG